MAGFIKMLLSLSAPGTLLIIILLLLKPLYKNRLSQRWQYYIWLLVIARLLLPITINYNIMENISGQVYSRFIQKVTEDNINQAENFLPEITPPEPLTAPNPITNQDEIQPNTYNTNGNLQVKTLIKKILISLKQNIFYIWLVTAISLFVRKITIYQGFTRYLKTCHSEVSSLDMWEQLGSLLEELHIKATVGLCINNMVSSPLLIGIFHPCIVIPSEEIQDTDFQNIIRHELIHFKRKDIFYKWLVQLTICIHWFNPFVYLIVRETSRLCELSCDEAVIKKLDSQGKKEYGNTLLNMVNTEKKLKNPIAYVTLNESKQLLKERLDKIMEFKKKTIACTFLSVALTLALFFTAATTGSADTTKPGNNIQLVKDNTHNNIKNSSYLNSSKNNNKNNDINKLIKEGRVILDNCIYHILCDGVTTKDMSSGGVSYGCIGITLEQSDGYISIGPIDIKNDLDDLVEYVEETCNRYINNKTITSEEAKLMTGLAKKLKEGNGKIDGIKDISFNKEYKKWNIVRKNNAIYYKNQRVCTFIDLKADKSFMELSYDKKGKINIKITRNKKGKITKIKYLSKKEADKYLNS